MPDIEAFRNLPSVSFIDDISIESLRDEGIADYEDEYARLTGEMRRLFPADPMRILINTYTLKLYQLYQHIDRCGKQDLLKYSKGEFLQNIAALRSVCQLPSKAAYTTLLFTLSTPLEYNAVIPQGTTVTGGDGVFFEVRGYGQIPAGELEVFLPAICTSVGTIGNNYPVGRLKTIVQPLPFTPRVANITPTEGGMDAESDQSLAERTFLAPSGYSVAGPDDAYKFWVRSYSQAVTDVEVHTPEPGTVDIRVLLNDSELPGTEFIAGLSEFLKEHKVRPFTDNVIIAAPNLVPFDINLVYYISTRDRNIAAIIMRRIEISYKHYLSWQTQKIGRDINPDVIRQLFREAGAKRLEITTPIFTMLTKTQLAHAGTINVIFGGLEDD